MTSALSRFLKPPEVATTATTATKQAPNADVCTSPDRAVWRYLIEHQDGELVEHSFSPWATRAEVSSWYPDARRIEALPDVHRDPTDEAAAA